MVLASESSPFVNPFGAERSLSLAVVGVEATAGVPAIAFHGAFTPEPYRSFWDSWPPRLSLKSGAGMIQAGRSIVYRSLTKNERRHDGTIELVYWQNMTC